jgi:hypothetical protein
VQVLTEIPAGVESGWHTHPGEEVGYILAGTVEMRIQGQSTLTLHAGDSFLILPGPPHNALHIGPETGRMLCTYIVEVGQPWRPHWRRLAVVGAPRSGAEGIDRSIRITKSLLDHLGLLGSGYLGVPARVLPSTRRARDGRKCYALPPSDPPATARWIVTAALLASLAGLVLSQIGAADVAGTTTAAAATAHAATAGTATSHAKPTVVLVHGAWADSGS